MITRNNYEELFLLYVDNELSPADKQAVERFVDEHPDLKEELEMLLQCRIRPDEIPSFPGKEQLMRSEAPGSQAPSTHAGNYETWFLSYVDNELDATSRQAVIDFVRSHPEKNSELQQLQRTVSAPDRSIVFPNKELLYRREEGRTKKIAWLPFTGIAAAALILGAVGLLIFHPFRTDQGLASSSNNTKAATYTGSATTASASGSRPSAPTAGPSSVQVPVIASTTPSNEKKHTVPVTPRMVDPYYIQKKGDNKSTPAGNAAVTPALAQAGPARPAKADPANPGDVHPVRPAQTVDTDPSHDLAVVVPKTIDRNAKLPVTMAVAGDQTQHDATGNMNASFATQALLSQTSYPDDGSLEETASPRKNKLRGIFRKVTRVLEKSTSREDDDSKKVTIGGFQFALK